MALTLSHGSHPGQRDGCLVEIVALLLAGKIMRNGAVEPDWLSPDKTDSPSCLSPCVVHTVRCVNDAMPERELWRLAPLLPRLLRAHPSKADARVLRRLAIWAARHVLDHVDPELHERCEQAIAQAEEDLWSNAVTPSGNIDQWAPGWNHASQAALTCGRMPQNALWAASMTVPNNELPLYLSDFLDHYEKAMVEEGQLAWDPDAEYPPDDEVDAVVQAILASRC